MSVSSVLPPTTNRAKIRTFMVTAWRGCAEAGLNTPLLGGAAGRDKGGWVLAGQGKRPQVRLLVRSQAVTCLLQALSINLADKQPKILLYRHGGRSRLGTHQLTGKSPQQQHRQQLTESQIRARSGPEQSQTRAGTGPDPSLKLFHVHKPMETSLSDEAKCAIHVTEGFQYGTINRGSYFVLLL